MGGGCDTEGLALKKKALDRADLSTWTFLAGALLVGGGAVLFVMSPSTGSPPPADPTARLGVVVGLGSLGLAGRF